MRLGGDFMSPVTVSFSVVVDLSASTTLSCAVLQIFLTIKLLKPNLLAGELRRPKIKQIGQDKVDVFVSVQTECLT